MAQFDNIFPVDLENGPSTVTLKTMYSNNKKANRVGFKLTKKGQPVTIDGTCVGTAILSNNATVPIDNGVVSGDEAYVVLPDACYSIPGPITVYVTIVNSTNGETATLLAAAGYVRITETDTIIDPGTILPSVTTLIDLINEAVSSIPADYSDLLAAIAPNYADLVYPVTAGTWCWYSGSLYRAAVDIPSAESWTAAHWQRKTLGNALAVDIANLKSAIESTSNSHSISISGTLHARINSGAIQNASYTRLAYAELSSESNLKITKDAGKRFHVGFTDTTPANGVLVFGSVNNATATEMMLVVPSGAKFVVIYYYNTNDGETKTENEMLASISITSLDGYKNEIERIAGYVSDVPSNYVRQEYLASTPNGGQYCSLGGVISNTTRIKCAFALQTLEFDSVQYVFGGRTSTSSNAKTIGITGTNRLYIGYGNTTKSYDVYVNDTEMHVVDYDKNKIYLDGDLVAQFDERAFSTPVRALMFAVSGSATSAFYFGAVKIYRCTVSEGDVITHDFVPVYDIDNDRFGMYDIVEETFRRNPSETPLVSGGGITTIRNNEKVNKAFNEITEIKRQLGKGSGREYVQEEADRVAKKVHDVQTGQTLTFIACSDLHYAVAVGSSDGVTVKASQDALRDMTDGILAVAKQTRIDFYTCFGDVIYQWQGHGADYDNGVTEMFSATKLLSEAFKNNPQIRMVGNHDPNCENSQDKEFSAYMMNSFAGIYSEMLKKDENYPYGGYGYHDFERQKVRFIVLNTSFYTPDTDLSQGATVYNIGAYQAYWLCTALDLSDKADADEWQIVIGSHVAMDDASHSNICRFTSVLNAYLNGGTWTFSSFQLSYNFSGKNAAKLALYLNGHTHAYRFKNLRYLNSSGVLQAFFPLANLYIPNGLPGRESTSTDGETYSKTANSAESTSFQVITVDFVNKIVYAHHYGAGIDIVMHYEPTTETSLTTELTAPTWASVNDTIATVSNGTVTPVADGYSMIYARSETDNCIEVWNYQSEL